MKTRTLTALVCLLLTGIGCGERIAPGDSAILAVLRSAEAGWNAGDLEAYMQAYEPGENLSFAGGDHIRYGWHQVLADYRSSYPERRAMGRLAFNDLEITRLGDDAALVTGRWRLDRRQDQPHGVFSLVMRHGPRGWRIVHDHTSSGNGALTAAEATITAHDLLAKASILTSPEMAGRLPGTEGYRRAAEWAAARFAALGLEPGGDQGYLQTMTMESNEVIGRPVFAIEGSDQRYQLGRDYVFRGFTGAGKVTAEVVFCGYGLSLPRRGYDDYAGVDVRDKIVLVFKQPPSWRPADGEDWDEQDMPRRKALTAAAHGARAVLLVSKPNETSPQPLIGSVHHGPGRQPVTTPQLQISQEVAARLLSARGQDLGALQSRIDEHQAPASLALGTRARVEVETRYDPAATTWNVVGVLPGWDGSFRSESVILGAHLDHVGRQADRVLFPGANDNASGSAAVLEIAEAFVQGGVKPRRNVVFVLFTGEESGLFGSRYHAEHPARGLESTAAMLNFDCVGCGDGIRVDGGKSAPLLWGYALQQDAEDRNLMIAQTRKGGGADTAPFFEMGLPTLYFVTTNGYPHLHQTTDTVETFNGEVFEAITRLGYRIAAWVADGRYQREPLQD
ncbi:hypothetical protein CSB20_06270 [bacterium DOLZORAL124_64_63]|nr:MAG: hypothetical protein CSB20_06270 [bacterium DOLZORAL124_64_63]